MSKCQQNKIVKTDFHNFLTTNRKIYNSHCIKVSSFFYKKKRFYGKIIAEIKKSRGFNVL